METNNDKQNIEVQTDKSFFLLCHRRKKNSVRFSAITSLSSVRIIIYQIAKLTYLISLERIHKRNFWILCIYKCKWIYILQLVNWPMFISIEGKEDSARSISLAFCYKFCNEKLRWYIWSTKIVNQISLLTILLLFWF